MPSDRIDRVARERFGYERLRPGQEEAIQFILDGRDTLAVRPTGSGKSAIYQIAALMIPGPPVAVSPLSARQRDQVESVGEQEAGGVAQVNSTVRKSDRQEASLGVRLSRLTINVSRTASVWSAVPPAPAR